MEYTAYVMFLLPLFVTSENGVDTTTVSQLTGKVMTSSFIYLTKMTSSKVKCATLCGEASCASFQYEASSLKCSLNTEADPGDCSLMHDSLTDNKYCQKNKLCLNGGLVVEGYCTCVDGYVGSSCERLIRDCSEGKDSGYPSGIYYIQPSTSPTSFRVKCAMGYGRIHILWRETSSMDFYRSWEEYRDGFGDVSGEFWLGLEYIHQITTSGVFELRIEIRLHNGGERVNHGPKRNQFYKHFVVEGEEENYRMSFSERKKKRKRKTTGGLSDCMEFLNGAPFSTFDRDNDNSTSNCAQDFQSGWWFNACANCNPTGRLLLPADGLRTGVDHEVFWTSLGDEVPKTVRAWVVRRGGEKRKKNNKKRNKKKKRGRKKKKKTSLY